MQHEDVAAATDSVNWPVLGALAAFSALVAAAAVRLYRYDPPPRAASPDGPPVVLDVTHGLGWRGYFLAASVVWLVGSQLWAVRALLSAMASRSTWVLTTQPGMPGYLPGLATAQSLVVAYSIALTGLGGTLLVLQRERRTSFPDAFLWFSVGVWLWNALVQKLVMDLVTFPEGTKRTEASGALGLLFFSAAAYQLLNRSEIGRQTFVARWAGGEQRGAPEKRTRRRRPKREKAA